MLALLGSVIAPLLLGNATDLLPVSAAEAQPNAAAQAEENQPPVCDAGSDITLACQGDLTTFSVDATNSYDPDGDPITFMWFACPGSFIADPTNPITEISLDTSDTCSVNCGVRVRVMDSYGHQVACRFYVQVVPGTEGCSHGFWKNKLSAWDDTGLAPSDDFDTVFGYNAFTPNRTLVQALSLTGGGKSKLAREAVAALLNALDPDVEYALAPGEVISLVHDALAAGTYEPLASTLETYNVRSCPGDHGGCHQGGGQHHCKGHGGCKPKPPCGGFGWSNCWNWWSSFCH